MICPKCGSEHDGKNYGWLVETPEGLQVDGCQECGEEYCGAEFWRLNKARRPEMLATLRLIENARQLAAKSKLRF